jgi:hypothetical protein
MSWRSVSIGVYSERSAVIGSTRVARRAGRTAAAAATVRRRSDTAASVAGSVGATS